MGMVSSGPVPGAAGAGPNRGIAWPRQKYVFFGLLGLMYAYVFWKNESFLFRPNDPYWQHIETFKWWLLPHGVTAAIALLLGPMQFSDRLRKRYVGFHRIAGRFYVAGAMLGAPLGAYVQYLGERVGATRSFTLAAAIDAFLWMLTTGVALMYIRQGKVQLHRQWMTRSFACAIIFIEVRVIIGLTGWGQHVEAIVWACVAMAIPLADLVLQWQESQRGRPNPRKAAVAAHQPAP